MARRGHRSDDNDHAEERALAVLSGNGHAPDSILVRYDEALDLIARGSTVAAAARATGHKDSALRMMLRRHPELAHDLHARAELERALNHLRAQAKIGDKLDDPKATMRDLTDVIRATKPSADRFAMRPELVYDL
jgi:hypothetical protein